MSLFAELKRRNVFRVAIAYIVASWLLLQIADVLVPMLGLPEWAGKLIFLILLIGFVPALIFAWAFEMTPEGLKREKDVDPTRSITSQTGRKLDRQIMVIMAVALAYFAVDKFWLSKRGTNEASVAAQEQVAEQTVRSIAVLPLADMSPQGDHEYFSDGLTEELLNILAKVKDLRVAGRTSSFAFKGQNEDLREIAKKLDVKSILEGSVRKDDARNKVRITLQLINAEDGYHLWSETYDRDLDDIFAIQEDVANEVAKALKVTLLGEEETVVEHVATTDLNAYDLYLRGLKNLNEFSYASLEQAEKDFQQSLALDPAYGPTQEGLLWTWARMWDTGIIPKQDALDRIQPLLAILLQKEPDNPQAHLLQAWTHRQLREHELADAAYLKALELNPRDVGALHRYGSFLVGRERMSEGIKILERAEQLEPYSARVQGQLAFTRMWSGQFEKALDAYRRLREIDPDNPYGYYGESWARAINGDMANGLLWDVKAHEVDPDDHELVAEIGEFWLSLGDVDKAEEWINRSLEADTDQQIRALAAQITLMQYREQYDAAYELAVPALDLDARRNAMDMIRNAVARGAMARGEWQTALEAYIPLEAALLEDELVFDDWRPSWSANRIIEVAQILRSGDATSVRSQELLAMAEQLVRNADPVLEPYLAEISWAGIKSLRGETQDALEHLHRAFDMGHRLDWRFWIQQWNPLDPLRGEPGYRRLVTRYEEDMDRQRDEAYRLLEAEVGP